MIQLRPVIFSLFCLFLTTAVAQEETLLPTLNSDCSEQFDYLNPKNDRLVSFKKRSSHFEANFEFRLNCGGKYAFYGEYKSDSLFIQLKDTSELWTDCDCLFKVTLKVPRLNSDFVFLKEGKSIGINTTEFKEYPPKFKIWKGDTINYFDKHKRKQGVFILGIDKAQPSGVLEFQNDTLLNGWRKDTIDNKEQLMTTYNVHSLGDGNKYVYSDSNGLQTKVAYRFFIDFLDYVEFGKDKLSDFEYPMDRELVKHYVLVTDTSRLLNTSGSTDQIEDIQDDLNSGKYVVVVLLREGEFSQEFIQKLNAIQNKRLTIVEKKLIRF